MVSCLRDWLDGAGRNFNALDTAAGIASEKACGTFLAPRLIACLAPEELRTALPASEPSSKAKVVASFGLSRTKAQNTSTTDSDFTFLRLIKNSNASVTGNNSDRGKEFHSGLAAAEVNALEPEKLKGKCRCH